MFEISDTFVALIYTGNVKRVGHFLYYAYGHYQSYTDIER